MTELMTFCYQRLTKLYETTWYKKVPKQVNLYEDQKPMSLNWVRRARS